MDKAQQVDDPFIERPDEHAETGDELYCWMPGNYDRECNGSCVAFSEGFTHDPAASPCKVLNIMRVLGTAAQTGALFLKETKTRAHNAAVAAKTNEIPDPPEVR